MNDKTKWSFLHGVPAWALSLYTAIISFILLFAVASLITKLKFFEYSGELVAYILHFLWISIACYLICKKYSGSFWYTPLICNIVTITYAVVEPIDFANNWIYIVAGWAITIIASVVGFLKGSRREY